MSWLRNSALSHNMYHEKKYTLNIKGQNLLIIMSSLEQSCTLAKCQTTLPWIDSCPPPRIKVRVLFLSSPCSQLGKPRSHYSRYTQSHFGLTTSSYAVMFSNSSFHDSYKLIITYHSPFKTLHHHQYWPANHNHNYIVIIVFNTVLLCPLLRSYSFSNDMTLRFIYVQHMNCLLFTPK